MKKLTIFIVLIIISFLIISASSYLGKNASKVLQPNAVLNNSGTNQSGISESVLSTHNTESDCWVAYSGKVYDITSWLHKHPGGVNTILPYCGTSSAFEGAFNKKHGAARASWIMQVGNFMGMLKYQGALAQ